MTYGLTEPFLLWENKRQLVMHGAKKILKQRHQQRNTTAWKDRVQSAVHIYKVILPAAPALSFCLLLPQTECQCSSSPASQALHPRHEGGDVNQSVFGLDGAFMLAVEPQEAHPESRRNYSPGTAPFFALASICSSTLLGPYGNFSGIHQNKLTAVFPPHYLCMNMAFTWYNFFPGVLCSSDVFK